MTVSLVKTDTKEAPFAWSYSRLRNFERCARRYHEVDILKNFKEESEQLQEGLDVHQALAKRIAQGAALPERMPYEHWIDYVSKGTGVPKAEKKLAITRDFRPCDFFAKDTWLRAVADVLRIDGQHAHIVDWKTGKVKPDLDQLIILATCVMVHYPRVHYVTAELVWLKENTQTTRQWAMPDLVEVWRKTLRDRVNTLGQAHEEKNFPPNPSSGLCMRWCPVTSCEHCGQ